MFGIPVEHLQNPWVLVGVIFLCMVFGLLVPRPMHKALMRMKDEIIADQRVLLEKRDRQIDRLLHGSETTLDIARKLQEEATEPAGNGDS